MSENLGVDDAISHAQNARKALLTNFNNLVSILNGVTNRLAAHFQNLIACGKLDPALGLLIAQLKFFIEVETHTNDISDRHNSYYYET